MNLLLRLSLCAGALSCTWAGLQAVDPQWMAKVGPALRDVPAMTGWLHRETDRQAALAEANERVLERLDAKRRLAHAVLAGRMPLAEAAARFGALNRGADGYNWGAYRAYFPGRTDDECHCLEVLAIVEAEAADDPCATTASLAVVHEELRRLTERGPVRFGE
jgi:hypothetical protein